MLLSSFAAATILASAGGVMAADPNETADQVFQIYVDTLKQANALLEGTPPAAEVEEQFDALKEEAVTQLVVLGHKIAAMNDSDRATVEGAVNSSVSSIHRKPETKEVYEGYQAVWAAYVKSDMDFWQKIKSLNILTQYAFFDLLRKQEPEEADRLGV
jgi:hypothetical protein